MMHGWFPMFLVLRVLCGCSTNHPIREKSGQEPVGRGTIIWDALDDQVRVIIWFDISWQDTDPTSYTFSSKGDATTGHVKWHRGQSTREGRRFDVSVSTDDNGKTGEI